MGKSIEGVKKMEHREKMRAIAGLMNLKSGFKKDMSKTHEIIRDLRIRMEALLRDTDRIKRNMDLVDEVVEEVYDGKNLCYMMNETSPHFMLGVRKRSRYGIRNGKMTEREQPRCELEIIRSKLRARAERERRNLEYDNHD